VSDYRNIRYLKSTAFLDEEDVFDHYFQFETNRITYDNEAGNRIKNDLGKTGLVYA
jgi:hypothetical protein